MDFELTKAQEQFRKTIRGFTENEIRPIAGAVDRYEATVDDNIKKLAALHINGIAIPVEEGGAGGDHVCYAIACEEVAKACTSTATLVSAKLAGLLIEMLYYYGTPAQKEKYLQPFLQGELEGCFGLTEPEAGSDPGRLCTTAIKDGSNYIINGTKTFITGAPLADFAIVMASTNKSLGTKGITAFLVDCDTPGFSKGKPEQKMGQRGLPVGELIMKNVVVPETAIIGKEGMGFRLAMKSLDCGRLGIASVALGIAEGAYEAAVKYSKERVQFGAPICNNQAIQFMLTDMKMRIDAAQLLVYRAAVSKDKGSSSFPFEASMAKVYASEVAMFVTTKAVQIHGGYGYMNDYPVERMMRDAKLTEIYEGTSEIQRMVLARTILK
ncbi:acyl-CoA dehydrogenase family protein [uncultured Dysosmobacter sp.]|uniref:acyl-CoA dehydrogenase family protein n=1 Tax=uncultured Dysosmobacter sp. TaxID=2591384 RepID=UPI00262AE719|nr:acyl-CoA dehydrogenase family protein [uncultured Dysosmobacter sp.]